MAPPAPTLPTTLVHTLATHSGPVNALTFSSQGGTYTLSGSSDRTIHLCRALPAGGEGSSGTAATTTITASPIQKYTGAHAYAVLDVACARDNQTFASAGGDRNVFVWDVQTAQTLRRLGANTDRGHESRVGAVRFAGGGGGGSGDAVLVSGGDDRSVRLWDLRSRDARPIEVWEEARDAVTAIAVAGGAGGTEIVVGSVDGRVRCYDVRVGRVVVDVFGASVTSVQVSRHRGGETMLVGSLDSRIRLIDRKDGSCLREFGTKVDDGHVNKELRIKSCFGGLGGEEMVLSGSEGDGVVRAWDVLTGLVCGKAHVGEAGKIVSVVRWRDGKGKQEDAIWAAGGTDGKVRIYGYGGTSGG